MYCPKCGKSLNKEQHFCDNCGTSLGNFCYECGKELREGQNYCDNCGFPCGEDPTHVYVENVHVTVNDVAGVNAKKSRVNKHIFVWVLNFLLGCFGADRFARGQIGLGIVKLLTFGLCGFWAFVDWVIAIVKVYGSEYADTDDIVFINGQYPR